MRKSKKHTRLSTADEIASKCVYKTVSIGYAITRKAIFDNLYGTHADTIILDDIGLTPPRMENPIFDLNDIEKARKIMEG